MALITGGVLFPAIMAHACAVPVFRYALERWQPGAYHVVVFHHGKLSAEQIDALRDLKASSLDDKQRRANFFVEQVVDLAGKVEPKMQQFYDKVKRAHKVKSLPLLVAKFPAGAGISEPFWVAPLTKQNVQALVDSPARREIAQRIIKGETAVWLLVESGNKSADAAVEATLLKTLRKFEKEKNLSADLPSILASAVGMFWSPYSHGEILQLSPLTDARMVELIDRFNGPVMPLRLRFSVLRIKRDAAESFLLKMLLHSEPKIGDEPSLSEIKEPIVFPIYGRARARYALVGKGINADNVTGDAAFLTGPCTCTIKDQNPGFDLLLGANWDAAVGESLIKEQELPPLIGIGGVKLPTIRDIDPPPSPKKEPPKKENDDDSGIDEVVNLDNKQSPWKSLLDDLDSASKTDPASAEAIAKAKANDNKQANANSKAGPSGTIPTKTTQAPTLKSPPTESGASPLISSSMMRNSFLALIAGIVAIAGVYALTRIWSVPR